MGAGKDQVFSDCQISITGEQGPKPVARFEKCTFGLVELRLLTAFKFNMGRRGQPPPSSITSSTAPILDDLRLGIDDFSWPEVDEVRGAIYRITYISSIADYYRTLSNDADANKVFHDMWNTYAESSTSFLEGLELLGTGPASFNHFLHWQQQTGNGAPEQFPVWLTCFLDILRLWCELGAECFREEGSKPEVVNCCTDTWFSYWCERSEPSTTWFHTNTWWAIIRETTKIIDIGLVYRPILKKC